MRPVKEASGKKKIKIKYLQSTHQTATLTHTHTCRQLSHLEMTLILGLKILMPCNPCVSSAHTHTHKKGKRGTLCKHSCYEAMRMWRRTGSENVTGDSERRSRRVAGRCLFQLFLCASRCMCTCSVHARGWHVTLYLYLLLQPKGVRDCFSKSLFPGVNLEYQRLADVA